MKFTTRIQICERSFQVAYCQSKFNIISSRFRKTEKDASGGSSRKSSFYKSKKKLNLLFFYTEY